MIMVERHGYDITFVARGNLDMTPYVAVHLKERAGADKPLDEERVSLEVHFSQEGLSFEEQMQEAKTLAKFLNEHIAGGHHTVYSRPSLELVAQIMGSHRSKAESPLPWTETAETTNGMMARLELPTSGPKGRE